MRWAVLARELEPYVLLVLVNLFVVLAHHDPDLLGGGAVLWSVTAVVGLVDVLIVVAIAITIRDRRRCRRNGHPGWRQVGEEPDDPTPAYDVCTRCGTREPVGE